MAHHCRQREILKERRRKLMYRGNKFMSLLSQEYKRMEGGIAACPYKRKAQPTTYWGCGEVGHILWGCPNKVAQPRKAEAQHMRMVKKRKCGECGRNNHRDKRCPSVRLWEEG